MKYAPDRLAHGPASLKGAMLYQGWIVPVGCRTSLPSSLSAEEAESPAGVAPALPSEEPVDGVLVVLAECRDVDAAGRLRQELAGGIMVNADAGKTAAVTPITNGSNRLRWVGILSVCMSADREDADILCE